MSFLYLNYQTALVSGGIDSKMELKYITSLDFCADYLGVKEL